MDNALIDNLNNEQKKWLAIAVTGVVIADGVLDDSEIDFLENVLSFLENEEMVDNLLEMVRQMKLPPLRPLKVEARVAYQIFRELVPVAAAGGTLSDRELQFMELALKRLGFNDPDFVREALDMVKLRAECNRIDEQLEHQAGG